MTRAVCANRLILTKTLYKQLAFCYNNVINLTRTHITRVKYLSWRSNMRKILSLVLVVCMLLPILSGCGGPRSLTIVKDGQCTVIYDTETVSNTALRKLINALEKATGNTVDASQDETFDKGAILLGNVTLPDGTRIAEELRNQDYKVGIADKYYLIGGITDTMTEKAVDYFVENVLPQMQDGKLKVAAKNNAELIGEYRVEGITLGKTPLYRTAIVLPKDPGVSELRTAVLLRDHIAKVTGYELEITDPDKATAEALIRVGASLCETAKTENSHDYAITVKDKVMEIAATSYLGYAAAMKELETGIFAQLNEKPAMDNTSAWSGNGAELACQPLSSTGTARVMFSNIHGHDENGTMPVKQPMQMLTELYLAYLPDVLGFQECTDAAIQAGIFKGLEAEYAVAGNLQTATALLYRKSTMELLDSGYFGFNNMSEVQYKDASKGVTWGIFRVKATGEILMVGSTHLWWKHFNDDLSHEACRGIQMTKLKEVLTSASAKFAANNNITGTIPIFVGGDYNTTYNRTGTEIKTMGKGSIIFDNANDRATQKLTKTTHHAYAKYNANKGIYDTPGYSSNAYTAALDHIFTNDGSEASVTVNRVGILDDLYAFLSSDHNPIYADITFTAAAPKINR